jgi:hypothetical protein
MDITLCNQEVASKNTSNNLEAFMRLFEGIAFNFLRINTIIRL